MAGVLDLLDPKPIARQGALSLSGGGSPMDISPTALSQGMPTAAPTATAPMQATQVQGRSGGGGVGLFDGGLLPGYLSLAIGGTRGQQGSGFLNAYQNAQSSNFDREVFDYKKGVAEQAGSQAEQQSMLEAQFYAQQNPEVASKFGVKNIANMMRSEQGKQLLDNEAKKYNPTQQEYGLSPVYGTDENGNPVILQLNKAGQATQTALPEGVDLSTGIERVDLGTSWGLMDKRSGNYVGSLPKDLAGAEREKAVGKGQGEAVVGLPGAIQEADQAVALIDQLIAHPGRATGTGLSSRIDPRNYTPGTDAYDFAVMNRQLAGKAFLQAFESLKGGGQITETEGKKATEAIARLDTAQSDEEYVAALNELKAIAERGKQRAMQRAGQSPAGGGTSTGATSSGVKWSVE